MPLDKNGNWSFRNLNNLTDDYIGSYKKTYTEKFIPNTHAGCVWGRAYGKQLCNWNQLRELLNNKNLEV